MKTALMVTMMIAAAGTAGAQVVVHEAHAGAKDHQKQLQVLLEKTPSTGVHVTVETAPVKGAPYSGEAVTESVQVLADGNRIVRRNVVRVFRDGAGRTRREVLGSDGQVETVSMTDPSTGTSYMLHPATQTAHQTKVVTTTVTSGSGRGTGSGTGTSTGSGGGTGTLSHVTVTSTTGEAREEHEIQMKAAQPAAGAKVSHDVQAHVTVVESGATAIGPITWVSEASAAGQPPRKEDLGQQKFDGVVAKGTRMTTTIPAGAMGNEQPITVIAEEWFSPDLKVLVMTKHVDPRMGETTYRLTSISRSEPDASLFERPAGYTLK